MPRVKRNHHPQMLFTLYEENDAKARTGTAKNCHPAEIKNTKRV
jgi:hypothetical protein